MTEVTIPSGGVGVLVSSVSVPDVSSVINSSGGDSSSLVHDEGSSVDFISEHEATHGGSRMTFAPDHYYDKSFEMGSIAMSLGGSTRILIYEDGDYQCARLMFDDNGNPFWDMMNDIDDSRLSHSHLTYLSHSHLTYCRFDGLELYLTNSLIALCHTMFTGDVIDSVIYSSLPPSS